MKSKIQIASLILMTVLVSFGCKKEETKPAPNPAPNTPAPTENLIKIGETYISGAGAKALVYSKKAFETGYNEVYVALYDSIDGSRLSKGHFDVLPMMDMGMLQHSCPVENSEDTMTTNGYFKSVVYFSMTGTALQWKLNFNFHNHKNERHGEGSLGVEVKASSPSKFKTTTLSLDSNKVLFLSLLEPSKPVVGINDFEIVLHHKRSGMDYAQVNDYTIEIEPNMPSMGHGSPNNINPVHQAEGHYKGKVNYTMTGLWQVKLKLYKSGVLISDDQYFEMTLE
jgi:YtkA-like